MAVQKTVKVTVQETGLAGGVLAEETFQVSDEDEYTYLSRDDESDELFVRKSLHDMGIGAVRNIR